MTKHVLIGLVAALAACVGGQSREAQRESNVARAQQSPEPLVRPERDWKKAATGHGAVGVVPADVLERMERRSAPGADQKEPER